MHTIIALLLSPFSFLLSGYTGQMLWKWFVAEQFGVMSITLLQAVGLNVVVRFFTFQIPKKDSEPSPALYMTITSMFVSVFLLGYGWVVHYFMN
jgi:hypothetical protein